MSNHRSFRGRARSGIIPLGPRIAVMSELSNHKDQREFYRLEFPPPERPRLLVGRQCYEVIDCSARGVRLRVAEQPLPSLGEVVEGHLRFRRQGQLFVRGSVIRIQNGEIALHLADRDIPIALIRGEERHMLNHYRTWAKLRLWPPPSDPEL